MQSIMATLPSPARQTPVEEKGVECGVCVLRERVNQNARSCTSRTRRTANRSRAVAEPLLTGVEFLS